MLDPEKIDVQEIRNESGEITSLKAGVVFEATTHLSPSESARGFVLDYAKSQLKRRIWNDIYADIRDEFYVIRSLVREPEAQELIANLMKKLNPIL